MAIGKKLNDTYFTEDEMKALLDKIAPDIVLDDTVRGVTIPELAKLTKASLATVRGWERRGELPEPIGRRAAQGTGGTTQYLYDGCIVKPMRVRIERKARHEPLFLRKYVGRGVQERRGLCWPPLWSALGKPLHKGSDNFRYRHCITGRWKGMPVGAHYLLKHTKAARKTRRNRLKHEEQQIERDAQARIRSLAKRAKNKAEQRAKGPDIADIAARKKVAVARRKAAAAEAPKKKASKKKAAKK